MYISHKITTKNKNVLSTFYRDTDDMNCLFITIFKTLSFSKRDNVPGFLKETIKAHC